MPTTYAAWLSKSTDFAADHARARNIIIADTKFEFGLDKSGDLLLIDEALTPGLIAVLADRLLQDRQ